MFLGISAVGKGFALKKMSGFQGKSGYALQHLLQRRQAYHYDAHKAAAFGRGFYLLESKFYIEKLLKKFYKLVIMIIYIYK